MSDVMIPRDDTFLTIGDPATDGLSWTFHAHFLGLIGDFRINYNTPCSGPPPVFSDPSCDTYQDYILFGIGESEENFGGTAPNYINWSGTASTLTGYGGSFVYTQGDGTTYTAGPYGLATIQHPNGMKVTINYSGGVPTSAVTNTGYAFKFSSGGNNGTIYAVNMLAHGCATIDSCSASDSQISALGNPPSTFIGPDSTFPSSYEITDRAGKKWEYQIRAKFDYEDASTHELVHGPRVLKAFQDPSGYYFRTTWAVRGGLATFVDPRGTFVYSGQSPYEDADNTWHGTTKDPSGAEIYEAFMNSRDGLGMDYWDGLGRETSYAVYEGNHGYSPATSLPIAPYSELQSITYPEGDYVIYTYDVRDNVTSAVRTGKPGSGLSQSFTASYPATCTNPVTCNKPAWTRDAKGNETDYTYDPTHGGVLTVTLPADANSLRRKTFNTYTSFNTGDGLIYRLTRSETCGLTATQLSSLTACPSATTEPPATPTSVTVTDYGTSTTAPYTYKSFQPYSVTLTDKGLTPLVATTTYTYDVLGDVVAVDGPRTDVDDTSYKTYDANRRVVCEIGVDPDGTGTLVRAMTRHAYDEVGRELETDTGYGASTTDCTPTTSSGPMTVVHFTRMTYDAAGRVIKTELVQP